MLTVVPPGGPETLANFAPGIGSVHGVTLAQLDILAAASGGTIHAVSAGAVWPANYDSGKVHLSSAGIDIYASFLHERLDAAFDDTTTTTTSTSTTTTTTTTAS